MPTLPEPLPAGVAASALVSFAEGIQAINYLLERMATIAKFKEKLCGRMNWAVMRIPTNKINFIH
jgi:hypothetical protein